MTMTEAQEYEAFRASVEASLRQFYRLSASESTKLVEAWWHRLIGTTAFKVGIFLNREPIDTAADLAGVESVEITKENQAAYLRLLQRCRTNAMSPKQEHDILPQEELQPVTLGR